MIVFVAALRRELAPLEHVVRVERRERANGAVIAEGYSDGAAVALVQSGMGQERSRNATRLAIERYRPAAVVSVGFSGGVAPEIKGGDLVLGERLFVEGVGNSETQFITPDQTLLDACFIALEEGLLPARRGDLISVPAVMPGPDEKAWLGRRSSALLVDVESYWVGQAAQEASVPFLVARVASEEVGETLPDYDRFMDDMGAIRPMSAAWYFLTHPQHLVAAPVLAANARRGGHNLAAFCALFLTIVNKAAPVW